MNKINVKNVHVSINKKMLFWMYNFEMFKVNIRVTEIQIKIKFLLLKYKKIK